MAVPVTSFNDSPRGPDGEDRESLSIIIPCYNEAGIIAGTAEGVRTYMSAALADLTYELILIDDGSTDGTRQVLEGLEGDVAQVRAIHFPANRGRGAAIKAGISASRGDHVICLDADLSYDVDHIGEIMSTFEVQPDTDAVVVSAYMREGSARGVPWQRLALSRLANWILARLVAGRLSTVTCVVRGYRGDLIRSIPLSADGKELHLEIVSKLGQHRANIVEIPGRLAWRRHRARKRGGDSRKLLGTASRHLLCVLPGRGR